MNIRELPALRLDEIPGLALTLLPDGRVEFINRRTLEFYGQPVANFRTWLDFIHPDEQELIADRWRECLCTGKALDVEIRARHASGACRWLQSRIDPIRDDQARLIRWCGLLTDIDDRKNAEQALQAREMSLRLILDSIPGFIHTLTPTGEIEFVNKRILDYFGLPLEQLRDWTRVTHPDDLETVRASLEESLRTGMLFEAESRALRSDGEYRWFHSRGAPLRDASGNIVRWYHVLADVDDRKRAEDALRANAHHWRLIVDSIPGLICTNTPEGEVELVNKTLLDYTGKALDELRQWPVVVHPEDLPEVATRWQNSILTGSPFDVEVRVRRADGVYRWFHCRGRPVYEDGRIQRWCNLLTDIEDRRLAEERLRDTRARLARATQVATVGELSAAIAHEINQPLAAIVNNGHACAGWWRATPPNVERARLSVERIIRDGKSAAEVIQRIRALYRQAPPSNELLSVNDVIGEVCDLISAELRRKSISLSTELERTIPLARVDRVQLQQVISNLARNAVEAMEPMAPGSRDLRIVSRFEEGRIVVHVGDTGVGISDIKGIFEPFVTTKPNGMGMGLAICRSIIEAHGGQLWAARSSSMGSVVSFALPVASHS